MRKFLLILSAFICGFSNAQTPLHILAKKAASAPTTPTTFWQIGIQNEFQTSGPTGWKYIYGTPTNISTPGNVSFPTINTSTGGSPTISFVNGSGFITYYTAANTGSNTGLFTDEIIGNGWTFTNGASFTLGNLSVGQHYWLYVLCNAHSWEASTVSFTCNSVTSNSVNNSDNFGSSATSPWYTSTALNVLQFTASSTSHSVVGNIVSGTSPAVISAVVLAK